MNPDKSRKMVNEPVEDRPVRVTVSDKSFALYLDRETIHARVAEMAAEIDRDFRGRKPLIVGVLNGAFIFLADLMRALTVECEVDFIKLSSYGDKAESSRSVRQLKEIDADLEGRDVILVEDIVDTGHSMKYALDRIRQSGVASLTVVTLLHKPARSEVDLELDLIGFEIPDRFVIGYGLDFAQQGRQLPAIYAAAE